MAAALPEEIIAADQLFPGPDDDDELEEREEKSEDDCEQESVIVDDNDRRRIIPSDEPLEQPKYVGRVMARYSQLQGKAVSGTGNVFKIDIQKQLLYVITAAHNLVYFIRKEKQYCDCIVHKSTFERITTQNGSFRIQKEFDMLNCYIHPEYKKQAKPENINGVDIAIAIFKLDNDAFYKHLFQKRGGAVFLYDAIWPFFDGNKIISLYGFPMHPHNKNGWNGKMLGMTCVASYSKWDDDYIKTPDNIHKNILEYDRLDTTIGQSGSAIWSWHSEAKQHVIVGIHSGGNPKKKKEIKPRFNIGVRICGEILKWIENSIGFDNQYEAINYSKIKDAFISDEFGVFGTKAIIDYIYEFLNPMHLLLKDNVVIKLKYNNGDSKFGNYWEQSVTFSDIQLQNKIKLKNNERIGVISHYNMHRMTPEPLWTEQQTQFKFEMSYVNNMVEESLIEFMNCGIGEKAKGKINEIMKLKEKEKSKLKYIQCIKIEIKERISGNESIDENMRKSIIIPSEKLFDIFCLDNDELSREFCLNNRHDELGEYGVLTVTNGYIEDPLGINSEEDSDY
eukprot:541553_1